MDLRVRRRRRKRRKGNGRTKIRSSLNIYNFPPCLKRVLGQLERIAKQGNDQPTVYGDLGLIDNAYDLASFISKQWGMGKSTFIVQDMVENEVFALTMEEEAKPNNALFVSTRLALSYKVTDAVMLSYSKKVLVMHKNLNLKITKEVI
ncbi:uncharacterized protein LOC131061414 isoform X1 [Cryptomeria japonica]|uniref:uncharacterized protein LOC131061414 isoform X1 n=1 Tax=Cryptomeria japonica TaxID=3369 RepID=UPI0027D9D9ED|nr:uncharacterized protein LOC131061414 isoform X1 [Cryptomeria japonica]XP_059065636.1 uncharacterized protein LOC131061414 isoform X1 [Cryptomeria japonica]